MTADLFCAPAAGGDREPIEAQAVVLRGFALPYVNELLLGLKFVEEVSPFRRMVTPGGFTMSVALTNCGALGWTTDRRGYRYTSADPLTGKPWPPLPESFVRLARAAASAAGFDHFEPDACLVNRYVPGSRLSLHQDKNERDFAAPIISVSLGIRAVFLFGGTSRNDRPAQVPLLHGDVALWGGADRMRYHGVLPLKRDRHPLLGEQRINFTIRKAG